MMFDDPPCQGKTDLFYPPLVEFDSPHHVTELRERKEAAEAEAKAICQTCPYVEPCLEAGVAGEVWGIWGGKTGAELREIRKERRISIARVVLPEVRHYACGTETGYQHTLQRQRSCFTCVKAHAEYLAKQAEPQLVEEPAEHPVCGTEQGYQRLFQIAKSLGGKDAGYVVKCEACKVAHSAYTAERRMKKRKSTSVVPAPHTGSDVR